MNKYIEIYNWDIYYLRKLLEYLEYINDPLNENKEIIMNGINTIKQIIDEYNGKIRIEYEK